MMRIPFLHRAYRHVPNERAIVAHRGWSSKAPENTMSAFNLVLKEPLIDWIELDVQLSKDGVPVVIHDYKLNRTTNGTGWVKEHTLRELSKLDAGSWFDPTFRNERIPTLEQVLQSFCGKRKLNIELKTGGIMDNHLVKSVVSLVRQTNMQHDVVITSFDHRSVYLVRELDRDIRTGLIIYGMPLQLLEQLSFCEASLLSMDYTYVNQEVAETIIGAGYDLMAWTVNQPADIQYIASIHPQIMICSNYPDRVIKLQG